MTRPATSSARRSRCRPTLETLPGEGGRNATRSSSSTATTGSTPTRRSTPCRPNNYFMMGDNRDNSTDSRVSPDEDGVGYVPFENFVGKAEIIFFSIDEGAPALGVLAAGRPASAGIGSSSPSIDAEAPSRMSPRLAALEGRGSAMSFADRDAAGARLDPHQRAAARAFAPGLLPAARIPGRPRAGPRRLRHAVRGVSRSRGGRAVAPTRRPRAQGDLRRRRGADWQVSRHIRLGENEAQQRRPSAKPAIMGDVCEALIGAIYLDGGIEAARAWSSTVLDAAHAPARPRRCRTPRPPCRNGRRVSGAGRRRAIARSEREGPAHAPVFTVMQVEHRWLFASSVAAHGPSKRAAEQTAAQAFLVRDGHCEGATPA